MDFFFSTLEATLFTAFVALILLPIGVLGGAAYWSGRWRERGPYERPDPQWGLKVALHFLISCGWMICLAGLMMALADQLTLKDGFEWRSETRRALSIALAGALFTGGSYWLLAARTNHFVRPRAGRSFANIRLLLIGLIFLLGFAGALGSGLAGAHGWQGDSPLRFASVVLVAVPAWVFHLWLCIRLSRLPDNLASVRICARCGYDLTGLRERGLPAGAHADKPTSQAKSAAERGDGKGPGGETVEGSEAATAEAGGEQADWGLTIRCPECGFVVEQSTRGGQAEAS